MKSTSRSKLLEVSVQRIANFPLKSGKLAISSVQTLRKRIKLITNITFLKDIHYYTVKQQ